MARPTWPAPLGGIAAALLLLLAVTAPAFAVEPSEMLKNPTLEARAEAISRELRCVVCQNETIDESNAPLAHDLRVLLRQRLVAGDTDRQAIEFIVDRYGQFVLLKPRIEPATYLLWFGPLVLLLAAAGGAYLFVRRRAARPDRLAAPLSAEERQRLEALMRESG